MLIGLVLGLLGFCFFCWLLSTLAVYALPFYAGLAVSLAAFHVGTGFVGTLCAGVLASGATLTFGKIAFTASRTSLHRAIVGALYAAPATVAGYHVSLALAGTGMSDAAWQQALAVLGGILTGVTAYSRLVPNIRPANRQVSAANSLAD
jgi:hypothetical protein